MTITNTTVRQGGRTSGNKEVGYICKPVCTATVLRSHPGAYHLTHQKEKKLFCNDLQMGISGMGILISFHKIKQ